MELLIQKISKWRDRQTAKNTLILLKKIVDKIILYPQDDKYCQLSQRNQTFQNMIKHEECLEFLLELGFRKYILEFQEKWILDHVSPIDLAKLQNISILLQEYEQSIPSPVTVEQTTAYQLAKQRNEQHREYVDGILYQTEQDRMQVKERNEQFIGSLRRRTKKTMEEQDELERNNLKADSRLLKME
jgi:hypothetical protein